MSDAGQKTVHSQRWRIERGSEGEIGGLSDGTETLPGAVATLEYSASIVVSEVLVSIDGVGRQHRATPCVDAAKNWGDDAGIGSCDDVPLIACEVVVLI